MSVLGCLFFAALATFLDVTIAITPRAASMDSQDQSFLYHFCIYMVIPMSRFSWNGTMD